MTERYTQGLETARCNFLIFLTLDKTNKFLLIEDNVIEDLGMLNFAHNRTLRFFYIFIKSSVIEYYILFLCPC